MSANADKSVTIEWALGGTDVSNLSIAVDCCVVHTWLNADRSARFTTRALSVGRHTIAIQVLERYWTNTYYDPTSCVVSTNQSMCVRKSCTTLVLVSVTRDPSCIVPVLAGSSSGTRRRGSLELTAHWARRRRRLQSPGGSGSRPAAEGEDATRQRRDGHPGREQRPVTSVDRDNGRARRVSLDGARCARCVAELGDEVAYSRALARRQRTP